MCLDDKLGSAPAPLVVPEVGQLRQPSGNLSDGGVYMRDDTTHAAAATVEVAFSGGEWHVSDPDATEDDDDAVAMVHAEGSAATKASFANWAELPDGILREVGILSHFADRYARSRRRGQIDRWLAKCDMQNATWSTLTSCECAWLEGSGHQMLAHVERR